jgi:hypothetical protein
MDSEPEKVEVPTQLEAKIYPASKRSNYASVPRDNASHAPVRRFVHLIDAASVRPAGHVGVFVAFVALTAAVQLWVIGLWGADPKAMTDLGLVSLLGWATAGAVLILLVSFFIALSYRPSEIVLGAHLLTLIVLVHGTPAILFGTLRYSWAWKHIGIVDFILRHGRVDTTVQELGVYQDWPGFFGASALLAELAGADQLIKISIWAPVAFNIANLLALRCLFRAFRAGRTHTWLALLLYFLTTWVGQDYFSPQASAFLLFLVLFTTVARKFRPIGPVHHRATGSIVLVILLMVAIASSHQITPLMVFVALTVLFVARQIRGWYLPVLAFVTMVGWAFTVAQDFTLSNIDDWIAQVNDPLANMAGTFEKSATIRGGQHLVSFAGRAVIVIMTLVAAIGMIRLARRKKLDYMVLLLAGAPGLLLYVTAFDGELLFRIFLFASPFLSYFASAALLPAGGGFSPAERWRTCVPALVFCVVLTPGFFLAYYGKDHQNYFTSAEVAASQWVADRSRPGTLLVRGNTNYPRDFDNYEFMRNVDISTEPDWPRVLADPADVISQWLANPQSSQSFVLITRSQKISNDSIGPMEPGALQQVEDSLSASPLFREAYRNEDAVVFVLAGAL